MGGRCRMTSMTRAFWGSERNGQRCGEILIGRCSPGLSYLSAPAGSAWHAGVRAIAMSLLVEWLQNGTSDCVNLHLRWFDYCAGDRYAPASPINQCRRRKHKQQAPSRLNPAVFSARTNCIRRTRRNTPWN